MCQNFTNLRLHSGDNPDERHWWPNRNRSKGTKAGRDHIQVGGCFLGQRSSENQAGVHRQKREENFGQNRKVISINKLISTQYKHFTPIIGYPPPPPHHFPNYHARFRLLLRNSIGLCSPTRNCLMNCSWLELNVRTSASFSTTR